MGLTPRVKSLLSSSFEENVPVCKSPKALLPDTLWAIDGQSGDLVVEVGAVRRAETERL